MTAILPAGIMRTLLPPLSAFLLLSRQSNKDVIIRVRGGSHHPSRSEDKGSSPSARYFPILSFGPFSSSETNIRRLGRSCRAMVEFKGCSLYLDGTSTAYHHHHISFDSRACDKTRTAARITNGDLHAASDSTTMPEPAPASSEPASDRITRAMSSQHVPALALVPRGRGAGAGAGHHDRPHASLPQPLVSRKRAASLITSDDGELPRYPSPLSSASLGPRSADAMAQMCLCPPDTKIPRPRNGTCPTPSCSLPFCEL